jgi:RNA polymerase sigma-70 factor (subfamily 1)
MAEAPHSDAKTAGGDPLALQLLLHAERARLRDYVRRHLPIELSAVIDVQDVLQDTYINAFRRMGQFTATDPTNSVFRWLVTIARHRIAELLRLHRAAKRGGRRSRDVRADDKSLIESLSQLAVYQRTPSRSAAAHEFLAALEQSLRRLPDAYRDAVNLRYIQGLTPGEVATRIGRTERAVHMLCNRGLKAVRLDLRSASLFL